jgi:UDP-N-acetyl-alpha-D-quinovosamine dehydrogenase
MRVLVTGVSGFIGRSLAPALEARGHEVRSAINGCDAVVHLANIAHTAASPVDLQRVNVDGTRRQAEEAAAAGVRGFVYLSSAKAAALDDAYGRAKLAAEQALARVTGVEVVVLRPPLVYGPGVKANFLALMRAIARGWPLPFASVENRRSLVYVGNLCDAIIHSLEAPQAAGRTYFVSDGAPVSTPQLCRALGTAMQRPARLFRFPVPVLELHPGLRRLTRSLELDDSAIRQELDWRPPYTFEQGLRATVEWYRKQAG